MNNINWDDYYMSLCYLVAMKSKDESTHIGAVIVGLDNEIRSTGYNSFVRGLDDNVLERQERPEKYYWFEHAERNAIYNNSLMGGSSLKDCRMFTNGIPCTDCARGIIQSGIKEVIVDSSWSNPDKWDENAKRTIIMFNETKVSLRYWSGELIQVYKFQRGEKF